MRIHWLEPGGFGIGKSGPKFLSLGVHVHDQLRTVDAVGEPGKIFYESGGGKLSARLRAFKYEWTEAGASGVNRCGQAGAAAPDDDYLFHHIN